MIADAGILLPASRQKRKTTLALTGLAIGLAVAIVAFLAEGGDENAARFAAGAVFRASILGFLAYYLAAPVARLFPSRAAGEIARARTGLALGFAATYAVFLGLTVVPALSAGQHVPLPVLTFAILSSLVVLVLVVAAHYTQFGYAERAPWRTLESSAVVYFWLVFAIEDLNRLYGPHRPDALAGVALVLLVLGLFVRFADAFMQRRRLLAQTAR
jgi:hypothetical protein